MLTKYLKEKNTVEFKAPVEENWNDTQVVLQTSVRPTLLADDTMHKHVDRHLFFLYFCVHESVLSGRLPPLELYQGFHNLWSCSSDP
jgi:hypothetical protein